MNTQHNYTDHLGNIRLQYTKMDGLRILEEDNYYPFGLKQQGYNNVAPVLDRSYKYKYNGKELQEEFGLNVYDYGARNYDAALGRWMNIDPLAEKYLSFSPYNYTLNNPINLIDPDGRSVEDLILKFSNEDARNKTQENFDSALGQGAVSINKKGKVTLNIDRSALKNSKQKAFFDIINEASDPSKSNVVINISSGSEEVFIGNYETNSIDIADVNTFGNNELSNQNSVLGHEIAEQTEKQREQLSNSSTDFNKAHRGSGYKAENNISGNMRMQGGRKAKTIGKTAKGITLLTGKMEIPYYQTSTSRLRVLVVKVRRNNVVKVKTKK